MTQRRVDRAGWGSRGGHGARARLLLAGALGAGALAWGGGQVAAQAGSPAGAVPVERLTARRAAVLARAARGVVVVRSAEARPEQEHAQDSDFRQDDDFFYLTGLEESGAVLVGVAGGSDGAPGSWRLYLPERVPAREQWTGARLGPGGEAAALTGIGDVRAVRRLAGDVAGLMASVGDTAPLAVGGAAVRGCVGRSLPCPDLLLGPVLAAAHGRISSLAPDMAGLRLLKDADEIARLRRAGAITSGALREAMAMAAPGEHEYDVEAVIEAAFRHGGAERVGFPTIVGSGPNSTVLHYDKNRRLLQAGDLVVMDVGAEYGYYTADITRTIPVSGQFTPRQRAIYDLVLGTQQAAIDSVRPGSSLLQLETIARAYMKAHSGTLCGEQTCDRYFIHGLSHWLGMDVHDVGTYMMPLQAGMVLTMEPGVYLSGESLGVRIEDDVLVTATGHEVLTADAPRTAAEVERTMRSGRATRAGTK